MTKEQFQKRIAFLAEKRQERIDQANALSGAIEEIQFWIATLEQPEAQAQL